MNAESIREKLELHQIWIYFTTIMIAGAIGLLIPDVAAVASGINPALALMLFVTFLQVPLADLGKAVTQTRFMTALITGNFIAIPFLVAALIWLLPEEPMVRLGVLLVLLTPCIDYVVTFSHLGRADAHLLLAATPVLLLLQILLLPLYLGAFLGESAAELIKAEPFIHAFVWLIAVPLVFAALVQFWSARSRTGKRISEASSLLPVPATALVLFVVIVAVIPQLGQAADAALKAVPAYIVFALLAPFIGWFVARLFRLDGATGRAVAFSAATRNSLVVLPLAFAVPGAVPVLPAIIVTQTLVELVSQLGYVRLIAKFGRSKPTMAAQEYLH